MEAQLLSAIRHDISEIRTVIADELQLIGDEELEELENLARIEGLINTLLDEYQSVLNADYGVAFADEWGRMSRILDKRVDEDFNLLIRRALDEELRELNEARVGATAKLAFNQRLAWILLLFGVATAAASLWWLVRDLRAPVERLVEGAEAIARGDLRHRIPVPGNDELAGVGHALNRLAGEVAGREQALAAANQHLEHAVAERTAELERLLATLKRTDDDRRRLLADVSHELRTPLTVIRGEADIALRGGDKHPDLYREALARTRDAAEHTAQLVDDLLFIARREAGEVRLAPREFDLAALLPAVVAESRSLGGGAEAPVRLHTTLADGPLRFDGRALEVTCDGQVVELTARERDILQLFLANPGRVLSRERILNTVWSVHSDPQTNVVDVYVGRLRKKLGACGVPIETVRGTGYRYRSMSDRQR